MKEEFDVKINTHFSGNKEAPLALVLSYDDSLSAIVKELETRGIYDLNIVEIFDFDWENLLVPWSKNDEEKWPKKGNNSEKFLTYILDKFLKNSGLLRGFSNKNAFLVGYSLAGLFTIYASKITDKFQGFISCSGSLWYPGFVDYFLKKNSTLGASYFYISLGSKEKKTKNQLMRKVEDETIRLVEFLKSKNVNFDFEINDGGHFQDVVVRQVKGIEKFLKHANK